MIDALLLIGLAASGGFLLGWWTHDRLRAPAYIRHGEHDVTEGNGLSPETVRHHYEARPAPTRSAQASKPNPIHSGRQEQRP